MIMNSIDAGRGIEKRAGVMGGDACIAGTRISVWILKNYRRMGWSDQQILENLPTLQLADLANAWNYADSNQEEIEQAIQSQRIYRR
jgi:uncharacterized protein (DUF433 family)